MLGMSGFKTKRELRGALGITIGNVPCAGPHFVETGIFGQEFTGDGEYLVVGPSLEERKWFASVTVRGGIITRVT